MNTNKIPVVGETTVGPATGFSTVDWWLVNQIVGAGLYPSKILNLSTLETTGHQIQQTPRLLRLLTPSSQTIRNSTFVRTRWNGSDEEKVSEEVKQERR